MAILVIKCCNLFLQIAKRGIRLVVNRFVSFRYSPTSDLIFVKPFGR